MVKVRNSFTRFFIPFTVKNDLDLSRSPVWNPFSEKDKRRVTENLLPNIYDYFFKEPNFIRAYKLKPELSQILCKKVEAGTFYSLVIKDVDELIEFKIQRIELWLVPSNTFGALVIEIVTPNDVPIDYLIEINHQLRIIWHGTPVKFTTFSKEDNIEPEPINFFRTENETLVYDIDYRNRLLNVLNNAIKSTDLLVGENINFTFNSLLTMLCGDLFPTLQKTDIDHYYKEICPTGRLNALVYVRVHEQYGNTEMKARDLFAIRNLYNRKYEPSKEQLMLDGNSEIILKYNDITFGASLEGTVVLSEKEEDNWSENAARSGYSTIYFIALFKRWKLINLSNQVNQLVISSQKRNVKNYSNAIKRLRNQIMDFNLQTCWVDVSNTSQRNDYFDLISKAFKIEERLQMLRNGLDEIDRYLDRETEERRAAAERRAVKSDKARERILFIIQVIIFIFFPLNLVVNLVNIGPGEFFDLFLSPIGIVGAIALAIIYVFGMIYLFRRYNDLTIK